MFETSRVRIGISVAVLACAACGAAPPRPPTSASDEGAKPRPAANEELKPAGKGWSCTTIIARLGDSSSPTGESEEGNPLTFCSRTVEACEELRKPFLEKAKNPKDIGPCVGQAQAGCSTDGSSYFCRGTLAECREGIESTPTASACTEWD